MAMFQTLLGALNAFIGLSLHGAAGRKFYDGKLAENDLREFIGSCLQILMLTSLFSLCVLVAFSRPFSELLGLDLHWLLLAVLATSGTVLIQIRLGQWQVRNKAKYFGAMQVSKSFLNFGISLLLVVFFSKGSDGRIAAQVLVAGIFSLVALWLLNKDKLLSFFVWRPDFVREALRFGVPLIPHVGGMFLLTTVDRFVINSELGLAQAGVYMVAVQFGMAISLVFDAINRAYVPWLFERLKRNNEEEKRHIWLVCLHLLWCRDNIHTGPLANHFCCR